MTILFTGASSFTGLWFVRALRAAGHDLVMTFRAEPGDDDGLRARRVRLAQEQGESVFGCAFGSARFMELARRSSGWDLLCHHAAEVSNYRSPGFDPSAALVSNTRNARDVLEAMACPVLLTGSVFEPGEGAGSDGLRAFSPYGLSKGLSAQVIGYYADALSLPMGKFVIPNPFGPYEEPRFTDYLVKSWYAGEVPRVGTPAYIRDNIHVSLLGRAYADFASRVPAAAGCVKLNPSGYVEAQGAFAQRFAREMNQRLSIGCEVELAPQTEFAEPRIRINTDALDARGLGWNETEAWDELAVYYETRFYRQGSTTS